MRRVIKRWQWRKERAKCEIGLVYNDEQRLCSAAADNDDDDLEGPGDDDMDVDEEDDGAACVSARA